MNRNFGIWIGAMGLALVASTGVAGAVCDDGDATACGDLAAAAWEARRRPEAVAYYRRACDLGHLPSCHQLGALYTMEMPTTGVPKDLPTALALFRKTCEGGLMMGCLSYGELLTDEAAGRPNPRRAVRVLTQLCEEGADNNYYTLKGCFRLGELHERGEGVRADVSEARRLFRKACMPLITSDACDAATRLGG